MGAVERYQPRGYLTNYGRSCVALWRRCVWKYKVDDAKKGAYRGLVEPADWRIVKKEKSYQLESGESVCRARIFSKFSLHRNKSTQAGTTEEEQVKRQQRMAVMARMMRDIR